MAAPFYQCDFQQLHAIFSADLIPLYFKCYKKNLEEKKQECLPAIQIHKAADLPSPSAECSKNSAAGSPTRFPDWLLSGAALLFS